MNFSTIGLNLSAEASHPQEQSATAKLTAKTKGGAKLTAKVNADPLSGQAPNGIVLGCQSGNLTLEFNTANSASMVKVSQGVAIFDDFPTDVTYKGSGIGGGKTSHSLETKVDCGSLVDGLEMKINTNLADLSSDVAASKQFGDVRATAKFNLDGLVDVEAELKSDHGKTTANYKHNSRDVCLGHEFKDMYGLKLNAKSNLDNISDLPRLTLSMRHDVDLMN